MLLIIEKARRDQQKTQTTVYACENPRSTVDHTIQLILGEKH
jgi:hypothetical protein